MYIMVALVFLSFQAEAADCFDRNQLSGTINAGPIHPHFSFEVYFNSMTAMIDKRIPGQATQLHCNKQSDGTKTIRLVVTAHITYSCNGIVEGTDSEGYTVNMSCAGSNTSQNTVRGTLLKF